MFNKLKDVLPSDRTITSLQGRVYPTLAGGVQATVHATAWTLGTPVELIPVDTITKKFDIQIMMIEEISEVAVYELVIYQGAVEKGRVRFTSLSSLSSHIVSHKQFSAEPFDANSQVNFAIANSTSAEDTVTISVEYVELD
jgi:hypothetical protein